MEQNIVVTDTCQGSGHTPLYNCARLLEKMRECGITFTHHHHVPVFTVEAANDVSDHIPGLHTRNLFLRDKKGRMFLVTLQHQTPVDLKKLSDLLGVGRFSFGSPDRLWKFLGVRPGSVTPLSILNDVGREVQLILEEDMMRGELVNFHPLENDQTIGLTPQGLLDILGHHDIIPRILDLSGVAPDGMPDHDQDSQNHSIDS